jgi:lysophospholipid acyltransferase (LPLAT)-like uncharacterized protein
LRDLLGAIGGWFLAFYAKLIHRTSPLTIEGWEHVEAAQAAGRPIIFANWHGQVHLFYAVFATHFDLNDVYLVMVGDERQGVLGHLARFIGAHALPVDMQDTSMAAARNLRNVIQQLTPGRFSYIAPDGPDGPARVAKPGVVFMARQAKALIVPVGNASRLALHIPRWDHYWLPLPFDRIYTAFGPPIEVTRGLRREEAVTQLSEAMNQADAQAREMAANKTPD